MHVSMRAALLCAAFLGGIVETAPTQIRFAVTSTADDWQNPAPGSFRWALEQANRSALLSSPTNPIIVTIDSALAGQAVRLTGGLPFLRADDVTFELAGSGPQPFTIESSEVAPGLNIAGDRCTFRGLAFVDVSNLQYGDTVILMGTVDVLFDRCHFRGAGDFGLFLVTARKTVVRDCLFADNRAGGILCSDGSDDATIEGCTFQDTNTGFGVYLAGVRNTVLRHNLFTRCRVGLAASEGTSLAWIGPQNRFIANLDEAISGAMVRQLIVFENTIADNGGGALVLGDRCEEALVRGNQIANNCRSLGHAQIALHDSLRTEIADNSFAGSGTIAIVSQRCVDPVFRGNNIVADSAGGMALRDVTRPVLIGNRIAGGGAGGIGIDLANCNAAQLYSNAVWQHGLAGLVVQGCQDTLVGPGNASYANGGDGIQVRSDGARSTIRIESSVFLNARRGNAGVRLINADATVVNVTSAGNTWGVYAHGNSRVNVSNSILWENGVGVGGGFDRYAEPGAVAAMSYSIFGGGAKGSQGAWSDGAGNKPSSTANYPRFVDLANNDVHLRPDSPAIDAGTDTRTALPPVDADLQQRSLYGGAAAAADIGADEVPNQGGTPLMLNGPSLRPVDQNTIDLVLSAGGANAGAQYLMVATTSGTGTKRLPGGAVLPLRLDMFSVAWIAHPQFALGNLDGAGNAGHRIVIPPVVIPYLAGDLTFAFTTLPNLGFTSNPVSTRFVR